MQSNKIIIDYQVSDQVRHQVEDQVRNHLKQYKF